MGCSLGVFFEKKPGLDGDQSGTPPPVILLRRWMRPAPMDGGDGVPKDGGAEGQGGGGGGGFESAK